MQTPAHGSSGFPLVSVLIPCYNAEAWIEECIESALRQTYRNKEIIVVDDGSTDRTADIVRGFGDRINFERQPNSGANVARNHLTRLASGEWLQYLDADDYLLPDKIAGQMELLRSLNSSPDVIYSPTIIHYTAMPERDYVVRITAEDATLNFIRWAPFSSHGILVRRQAVLTAGGWKDDQPCCQEHELLFRLLIGKSRFAFSPTPGAVYRQHGSNTISKRDPMRVIRMRMSITDRLEEHLKASGTLSAAHRAALFVARLESARSAFLWDRGAAEKYCSRALESGSYWSEPSPSLSRSYQLAFRMAGFRIAELVASKVRTVRNR